MNIIEGDITQIVERGVIAHVVNNRNAMGAGVAKALYEKWPAVKIQYHRWMDLCDLEPGDFSDVNFVAVNDDITVANMVAQDGFGPGDRCYLNYTQLSVSLLQVNRYAYDHDMQVYLPYNVGCGLAGGNWSIVSDLILKFIKDPVIVRFGG